MNHHKLGPRAEYRKQESQRVSDSPTLSNRFGDLKSLTVNLSHFDPSGTTRTSHVKYQVNIANAKSVFRFECPNQECIRGDFDLSNELADAVKKERKVVTGEALCQGWRSKSTIDSVRCHNILRYKISLGY